VRSENHEFDVAVVGLGYVGLPALLMLANSGMRVAGVDTNNAKTDLLSQGEMPLDDEPGFASLLTEVLRKVLV
jgi:UDP-N-acetyl-D-mannosaminuronate dehydrogenase